MSLICKVIPLPLQSVAPIILSYTQLYWRTWSLCLTFTFYKQTLGLPIRRGHIEEKGRRVEKDPWPPNAFSFCPTKASRIRLQLGIHTHLETWFLHKHTLRDHPSPDSSCHLHWKNSRFSYSQKLSINICVRLSEEQKG